MVVECGLGQIGHKSYAVKETIYERKDMIRRNEMCGREREPLKRNLGRV